MSSTSDRWPGRLTDVPTSVPRMVAGQSRHHPQQLGHDPLKDKPAAQDVFSGDHADCPTHALDRFAAPLIVAHPFERVVIFGPVELESLALLAIAHVEARQKLTGRVEHLDLRLRARKPRIDATQPGAALLRRLGARVGELEQLARLHDTALSPETIEHLGNGSGLDPSRATHGVPGRQGIRSPEQPQQVGGGSRRWGNENALHIHQVVRSNWSCPAATAGTARSSSTTRRHEIHGRNLAMRADRQHVSAPQPARRTQADHVPARHNLGEGGRPRSQVIVDSRVDVHAAQHPSDQPGAYETCGDLSATTPQPSLHAT